MYMYVIVCLAHLTISAKASFKEWVFSVHLHLPTPDAQV